MAQVCTDGQADEGLGGHSSALTLDHKVHIAQAWIGYTDLEVQVFACNLWHPPQSFPGILTVLALPSSQRLYCSCLQSIVVMVQILQSWVS